MRKDETNHLVGTESGAIESLKYAIKMGAKVINASWGSAGCSQAMKDYFASIQDLDVVLSVAAGNSGSDMTYYPEFPAAFQGKNQITVGALDPSGLRALYSNFGSLVHLLAPGSLIQSTVPRKISGTGYAYMSGTSMAAPFVSGAAAVLFSKNPAAKAVNIKNAILSTLDLFQTNVFPRGILRLDRASQQ